MLENLTKKLDAVFKKLKGKGLLNEENISEGLREVRLALLEADVHFKVVKTLVENVRVKALGQEIQNSLDPGQQVVKVVWEELRSLLGGEISPLSLSPAPPTVFMLVGLQGAGKTTTVAKIARHYKRSGKRVLMVAADLQRPAAVKQLEVLGKEIDASVMGPPLEGVGGVTPSSMAREAVERGRDQGFDLIILDTAGRLHVDKALMEELAEIKKAVSPHEVLLVADAMTGQDAVSIAGQFDAQVGITGVVLTKTEGDARGGAVLSIRAITGAPVKFIGTGEKLDALEPFYPDRMASRILGMGDVLSLIERAEEAYSKEQAQLLETKLRKDAFTLEDFKDQIQKIKKMGSFEKILEMIPGGNQLREKVGGRVPEKEIIRVEAMINSMTPQERTHPEIINGKRRRRIARGSGTTVQEINRMLKQFHEARKLMKAFSSGGKRFNFANRMNPW
jgi:signal recognition particle subunit SRP54